MLRQRFSKVKAAKGGTGVVNNYNFPPHTTEGTSKQNTPLKNIWWPKKKPLIESLHERIIGDKILVDELHDRLVKDKNHMVVIIESLNASELTGMGGIGKTLTATWYAHKYEHKYDHVMWMDCGEGSLLTSFKRLTRDLDIKNRNELVDEEEFSTKSYEELMQFKCLWIFDNAENYKGQGGIIKILPKYMENFFCLITSRSRLWGIEKSGFGKISDLQLDIFTEQESMDFFEDNFKSEIKYNDFQLKELCRLLGNLPLAMQLAVAALNSGRVDLENYIEKTSSEDVENIVDAEFDDYERTINASVKIVLDVLEKEENGIVAKNILNIFGYIQPDDVIIDLFQEVLKLSFEDVDKGIILLEKYSLISKELKTIEKNSKLFVSSQKIWQLLLNGGEKEKETKLFVNIHRLLQQVVRHNGGKHEKETLKNILNCEGFVDYKLLPFTKFADEELRKEFPKVKAELMDQKQLVKLMKEKKCEESVQLSRFIDRELQKGATKFNYAICLEMNGQLEENLIVLEELYKADIKEEIDYHADFPMEMGLFKLEGEVTKCLVGGHLLVSYWKMNIQERLKEILEERKSFLMIPSEEKRTTLLRILNSNVIQSNYSIRYNASEGLRLKVYEEGKKGITFGDILLDLSIPIPIDLQELSLLNVQFKDANVKDSNIIDISEWLPNKLTTLTFHNGGYANQIILSLKSISSIENITLSGCSLSLDSAHQISPKQLTLLKVSFFKNGQELSNVKVNEFIDFQNMKRLELRGDKRKNLWIDLSVESATIEYLSLKDVNILSLKSTNGNGSVNIKEAEIVECSLDLSILPSTLETLKLLDTDIFVSGEIDLPNLKYLKLNMPYFSHFQSLQLTYLYLHWMKEVNLDLLPPSAKIIRLDRTKGIDKINIMINRTRLIHLDKLILNRFPLTEVEEILSHFNVETLVLFYPPIYSDIKSYKPDDLIQLVKLEIPTIAIGGVVWGNKDFENSILSKQVDRQSEYYLFSKGMGKAIWWPSFSKLYLRNDIFNSNFHASHLKLLL